MAQIINFSPPPRDARAELCHKFECAPREHVEALLDLYAILQLLHDKGILELTKGLLGSGEKVLGILTETLEADEVVRCIRNLVILVKVLGAIEPESLQKILQTLGRNMENAKNTQATGNVQAASRSSESRNAPSRSSVHESHPPGRPQVAPGAHRETKAPAAQDHAPLRLKFANSAPRPT